MVNIYSTPSDYWIKPGAFTISLNALDNPQYLQASVLSGAVIMAYKAGVIEYDSSHNYRKWNLEAYNNLFDNTSAKYVYARLDVKDDSNQALIVYSSEKLDIRGKIAEDESSVEDSLHFFIYLGSITASVNNDGESIPRIWDDSYNSGTLATDQAIREESKTELAKMFRLNEITGMIDILKSISEATIGIVRISKKIFFGEKEIIGVKRSIDSEEGLPIGDDNLATSKYVEKEIKENAISRKNDDTASGIITFQAGLISNGLIEANSGLVVRKTEVVEPLMISLLSEEFEDNIVEENEDVFIEELRSDTTDTATLGELDNVADEADKISKTDDLLVRLAGTSEWSVNTTLFSQVSQLMSKVFPFTLNLTGGGTYEKGSSQTINLSWTYDRDIESQSINNESLSIGIRAKQYINVTSDTTYTLKAIQGGQTYTKSVSAQFRIKKYYGVSANSTLTNDEILALSSTWAVRTQGSTTFDCTSGKFPYYILPTSMVSGIQFWIGGLRNTDWNEEVCEVTNSYGHKESYTIYRLNSIQTGVLNIEVK